MVTDLLKTLPASVWITRGFLSPSLLSALGSPAGSVKIPPANARDPGSIPGSDPWVGKIPWRREWLPTPVFLPGKSHGQSSLTVQWSLKRVPRNWAHRHSMQAWNCHLYQSVSSVAQSCLTVFDPMDCSTPGFPVCHQLPELTQTQPIESVMPSNHLILSSPSPPTFSLSQHHSLLQWVSSSHQVAKILAFQFQHQSFQWIFRTDFL